MESPRKSSNNSSKITRRFSSPVTDSSRVSRLCQPSAGARGTTEGSSAERLSVRFGRSGRDTPPRGSDDSKRSERPPTDANFIEKDDIRARFSSHPALSSRRTLAEDRRRTASWNKGRLLDGVMASRAKGQSKATRRERTSEEISRRIKRKGETERERKKKKKRGENNTRTS